MDKLKTLIVLLLLGVSQQVYSQGLTFENFKYLDSNSNCSFRGLSVVNDEVAWLGGKHGLVWKTANAGLSWSFNLIDSFGKFDFRTIYAFNAKEAIIANAGSPAYVMRTSDGGNSWKTVYTNTGSLAFIDGVDFWNNKEGMIYGDPIKGRMLLLKTTDGGKTWQELPEQSRPLLAEGEASFAASGTGIRCYGKEKIIIATGGKVSRLFVSKDKGNTWSIITSPIIQGQNSAGIFSFAFANDSVGIIVGGDYLRDTLRGASSYYTTDGGKSWKAPITSTGGYRECVEFINQTTAIAAGPGGVDITYNAGKSWTPCENQKSFHVIRKARKGKLIIGAGNEKISVIDVNR